jgi:hypothetical protein
MRKKDKKYIEKIRIIAKADIECGNKSKLENLMDDLIKKEDYETCEGINQALKDNQ